MYCLFCWYYSNFRRENSNAYLQVIKVGPNKRATVLLSSCFYTVLIAIKYIEVHSYLEKDGARRKSQQILPEVWAKKEVLLDSGYSFNSHAL